MQLTLRHRLVALGLAIAVIAAGAFAWHRWTAPRGDGDALAAQLARAGIGAQQRTALEALIRAYILDHPEVLPEALDRLQAREASDKLKPLRAALETPFPGAVLGNPRGKVTLVEFTDFACPYCKGSVADIDALIATNADLRVVVRELPIISPQSEPAARIALAAAAQGRFPAYFAAMFAGTHPDDAAIAAAAAKAGVNLDAARSYASRPEVGQELAQNIAYAHQLGLNGTPAFAIGGQLINGAIGRDALQAAINSARGS